MKDPSIKIFPCEFKDHQDSIQKIRTEVFVIGQGVDPALEMDGKDHQCKHVLATIDDLPIGTGRIDLHHNGKVGRVSVLKSHRGKGIGKQMMEVLEKIAVDNAAPIIWFHAQVSAVPFYKKLNYLPVGQEFKEAGIDHIKMQKAL